MSIIQLLFINCELLLKIWVLEYKGLILLLKYVDVNLTERCATSASVISEWPVWMSKRTRKPSSRQNVWKRERKDSPHSAFDVKSRRFQGASFSMSSFIITRISSAGSRTYSRKPGPLLTAVRVSPKGIRDPSISFAWISTIRRLTGISSSLSWRK